MRNDAFYSTIAQVIPALFLALAIQLVTLRRLAQERGLVDPPEVVEHHYRSDNPPVNIYAVGIALLGIVSFLAETSAVLVMLTGTSSWFPLVAGPVCALATLLLTLFVVWSMWVHLCQPWA
jgi:hypothetical protein